MAEKEKYSVTIMGRSYNLLSDKSPEDIKALEDTINEQIKNIRKDHSSLSNDMVYTLALLYFAEAVNKNKNLVEKQESDLISLKFENENYKSSAKADNEKFIEMNEKYDEVLKLYNEEKKLKNDLEFKIKDMKLDFETKSENLRRDLEVLKREKQGLESQNDKLNKENISLNRAYMQINSKIDNIISELEDIKDGN